MTEKAKESRNLAELRSIAFIITKDAKMAIKWDNNAETSYFEFESNTATITDNYFPKEVKSMPRIWKKCVDGSVSHEAGHRLLTLPLWSRYKRIIDVAPQKSLMQAITNIIEDIRIDRFIISRYRFDYGKRRKLLLDLIKDQIETDFREKKAEWSLKSEGDVIFGCLIDIGKFGAELKGIDQYLSANGKKDLETCLNLLNVAKYQRVKSELIRISKEIYNIVQKYPFSNKNANIPQEFDGSGRISGGISNGLQKKLEKEEEEENKVESEKKDLNQGYGAGKGKGEDIRAPEPNYERYFSLVAKNRPEITRLLSKLKQTVKPIKKIELFAKRGRIMSQIIPYAYVNSLRKPINRIYAQSKTLYEKQKIALNIVFDLSGSMNEELAKNVLTVLNEVFGNWLQDSSYSLLCFASNFCKIKTFFEAFSNTAARVGGNFNIGGGTTISPCLKASEKLFGNISKETDRIQVIVSDFEFWNEDKAEAERVCENMAKHSGIKLIFINLGSYESYLDAFMPNTKLAYKTSVKHIEDLPEAFVDVYEQATGMKQ